MGRRSTFKRVAKDHYPTIDPRAVAPLLPHLKPGARYAEPCDGDGHLRRLFAGKVEFAWHDTLREDGGGDALACTLGDADGFLTNPPWTRKLLHPLIVHLSNQAPTFALFDANWVWTKQARPFMPRLRKVIAVGRLIWIEGTRMSGKDDAAWYEFGPPRLDNVPLLYGQGCTPPEMEHRVRRICPDCGVLIDRFGKWRLKTRNGVPTPAHADCEHPSGTRALAPTPLFDCLEEGTDD